MELISRPILVPKLPDRRLNEGLHFRSIMDGICHVQLMFFASALEPQLVVCLLSRCCGLSWWIILDMVLASHINRVFLIYALITS